MAQSRKLSCDRCGAEIIDLNRCGLNIVKECSAKIHYWGVGAPRSYGEQRIDLCVACAQKFVEFLEKAEG